MPKDIYTIQDRERALRYYRVLPTAVAASEATGVHESVIRKWAREEGILKRRNAHQEKLSDYLKGRVEQMYESGQLSRRQIARMLREEGHDITQWTVYHHLKRAGILRERGKAVSIAQTGSRRGKYNRKK